MSPDPPEGADPARSSEPLTPRASREWQFLVTLHDRLRPLRDPVEIQDVATRLLGEHLGVNRVLYAEIDGDQFRVSRSYVRDVGPCVGQGPIAVAGTAVLDAYRRGESVAVDDVGHDPRFTAAEREALLASEIVSFVVVMLHKEGRLLAAFGVQSAVPRAWTGCSRPTAPIPYSTPRHTSMCRCWSRT